MSKNDFLILKVDMSQVKLTNPCPHLHHNKQGVARGGTLDKLFCADCGESYYVNKDGIEVQIACAHPVTSIRPDTRGEQGQTFYCLDCANEAQERADKMPFSDLRPVPAEADASKAQQYREGTQI